MVDPKLVPAIREAVKQNEIGDASPYCLSYAKLGQSGASFGIFQGDTNVNHTARAVLVKVLQDADCPADAVDRIIAAVSRPCPNGNPLSPQDTDMANNALASDAGRSDVDAMDTTLLNVVLSDLDTSLAAAGGANLTIDWVALLYIALWCNMTGAPTTLNKWLSGTTEVGLAPPVGPVVTPENLQAYLRANTFFQTHPQNFVHMQDSVNAGARLLPAG
jgi:hypothetical protein